MLGLIIKGALALLKAFGPTLARKSPLEVLEIIDAIGEVADAELKARADA